ncbi:hypothetical protein [Saccharothrix deserti]|uniref:hypothetical protein n=1 Tax=Saccharothrix deserti TaxID=2593674 RepID=UPI0013908C62|nr:hypothetical protein [Saccharothrix deserti]
MASGADGKEVEKRINQHIHPPVDDASKMDGQGLPSALVHPIVGHGGVSVPATAWSGAGRRLWMSGCASPSVRSSRGTPGIEDFPVAARG